MSEQLYRIKPLVWSKSLSTDNGRNVLLLADSLGYLYSVERTEGYWLWSESHEMQEVGPTKLFTASMESGKLACESHYRERLLTALEEV